MAVEIMTNLTGTIIGDVAISWTKGDWEFADGLNMLRPIDFISWGEWTYANPNDIIWRWNWMHRLWINKTWEHTQECLVQGRWK